MKNITVSLSAPYVFVKMNDKTRLVSSMILSTLYACVLITFVPQLMPMWMRTV